MNHPLTRLVQNGPIAPNVSRGLVYSIPCLTGLAMGWQWLGLSMILASKLSPSPGTAMMLGTVLLLAAALGPWLPERIVLAVLRFVGRHRYGQADGDADAAAHFWMLRAIRDRDESLLWLSLSVLACVAGVLAMITLVSGEWIFQLYDLMLKRFFWNHLTLTAFEWFLVVIWLGMSWVINGLVVATLPPVMGTENHAQRDSGGVSAGIIGGLGMSWILHRIGADAGFSGHQTYLSGVLTLFAVAAISAWLSQHTARASSPASEVENSGPELSNRGEGLIWLSLVAWGAATSLVSMGWLASRSAIASAPTDHFALGGFLILLGLGVLLASFHARARTVSACGCGMALWAAGVGAAIVATMAAFKPSTSGSQFFESCILALPIGYALRYAERAWLARVGNETIGFAQLITAIFGGLAIGLIVGYWWLLPRLGPIGTISAGSLLMLGLGGFVQIYEHYRPIHTRQLRLAIIFASLAGATVIFPADVKRWMIQERTARIAGKQPAGLDPAIMQHLAISRHVCFIQSDPESFASLLPMRELRGLSMDVLPLRLPMQDAGTAQADSASLVRAVDPPTWLRLEHRKYDLIYQRSHYSPAVERFGEYSIEWFTQLNEHISPGGQICIDVPLKDLTREAVATIVSTFVRAMGASAGWTRLDLGNQHFLRIRAGGATSDEYTDMQFLFVNERASPIHSLARDRITRTIQPGTNSTALLISWLDSCQSRSLARIEP